MVRPSPLPPMVDEVIGSSPLRPTLANTEQRIFQEVVNLMFEINDIKEAIKKEK
jgi:hypothetical protein